MTDLQMTDLQKTTLDGIIAEMALALDGQRDETIKQLGIRTGSLTASGELKRPDIIPIVQAAISAGFPEQEFRQAMSLGFQAGVKSAATAEPATTKTKPQARDEVIIQCADDMEMKPIEWLWPGWLPKGKLTILAGKSGAGKTTLALLIAATITAGNPFPDGLSCEPGKILIWSGEDAPEDTLIPRLKASGADPKRCFFIQGAVVDGKNQPFDPARDIPLLEEKVKEIGNVALLIIDPVVNAVSGDMNKANDVRRCLQPLVDFGLNNNCSVLGISHFTKRSAGSHAQERVIGSQAFSALARMVLVAAQDEGKERRVLARAKSNIAPDHGGFEYTLNRTTFETKNGPIEANYGVWGKPLEGTSDAILSEVEGEKSGSALDEAASFLRDLLSGGEMPVQEIMAAGISEGLSSRTIVRAKKTLGAESKKSGIAGPWLWFLPETSEA